jgi:NarL family two-component system response regulator LiaR
MIGSTPALPTNTSVRILVVDDHAIIRKGIRAMLAVVPDIEVVGEAINGREAVEQAKDLQPDVILMDLVMPEMDGLEAIRHIKARQPEARILVLTTFAGEDKIFPAIKAGALGYQLKDSDPDDLVQAIRQVCQGEASLHPTIARKVLQELSRATKGQPAADLLTEQEVAVLRLVAQGRDNQEIAGQLVTDEAAVGAYVNDILGKLHLASRTQAALYALQEGLASLENAAPSFMSRLLATLKQIDDPIVPTTEGVLANERELESLRQIAADYRKVGQELALAGEIQTSFLPDKLPEIAGWQLAATLEPAQETSGDFYDFVSLPNGQLGLLVADVVGKGMGAALYMALSRTLIRTYAVQYPTQPDLVLEVANHRILLDTHADMFVTVFYGVLDPGSGRLIYSNAGHNPPYLLSPKNKEAEQGLIRTGIPLGMFGEVTWERKTVQLASGDMLILYTDGMTEAQDQQKGYFGQERLLEVARANLGRPAQAVQEALITAVHDFAGDVPNAWRDDVTVMVIVRDS